MAQVNIPTLDQNALWPAVVTGIGGVLSSPVVLWLWKKLKPGKQEDADVADTLTSAFERMLKGVQSENERLSQRVRALTEEVQKQRGRLTKIQAFMHVAMRTQDAHVAELEHIVITLGGDIPNRPEIPTFTDVDDIPLEPSLDKQIRAAEDEAIHKEMQKLYARFVDLESRYTTAMEVIQAHGMSLNISNKDRDKE